MIRHAEARRATVTVRYGVDAIGLKVFDDGTGPPPGSPSPGHRLLGMCERAALACGSLTYGRREGGGFPVAARLPAGRSTAQSAAAAAAGGPAVPGREGLMGSTRVRARRVGESTGQEGVWNISGP